MATCIIKFEDDGDDTKISISMEPPVPTGSDPSPAQRLGWGAFRTIQASLEIGDEDVHDIPKTDNTASSAG